MTMTIQKDKCEVLFCSINIICCILWYYILSCLGCLLKSCLKQRILKLKKVFKKLPPSSCSNDLEVSLLHSRFFVHDLKTTVSVMSVEIK